MLKRMIVLSGNDYVKFMTEELVSYLNLSTDEKKKRKTERKNKSGSFSSHWFGIVPMAFQLLFNKKRNSGK